MAIGVAAGLGAIAIVCLLLFRPGFLVIIAAAMVAAVWEMRATLRQARGIALVWLPLGAGVLATVLAAWWWGHTAQAAGLALTALAVLFWRLGGGAAGYVADVTASVFLAVYLGGFASFATLLLRPDDGAARILVFLIAAVCSDTGGYAAGVLAGRHPMAPRISPKKSWEGFAGSVVLAIVGGAVSLALLLHHPWWQGAVLGAVIALVATGGDLAESLIKRDLGVKDMGTLLPGHGGVMDRLDSLLPCAVVSWILLSVFVPV
ncbi:MAG TPA: phosphatidate cytidylyltransferase [Nakamurella sp.]|jgi:phosphatidate cytidylyltransferase|nr:phosphatidate cytidylyltransferase [Nakamurella sp.]